jgi:hypothetical protein
MLQSEQNLFRSTLCFFVAENKDSDSGKWLDKRINRILLKIGTVHMKYTTVLQLEIFQEYLYLNLSLKVLNFSQKTDVPPIKNNNLLKISSALAKTKFRIRIAVIIF